VGKKQEDHQLHQPPSKDLCLQLWQVEQVLWEAPVPNLEVLVYLTGTPPRLLVKSIDIH
jgi:hypothetical protein